MTSKPSGFIKNIHRKVLNIHCQLRLKLRACLNLNCKNVYRLFLDITVLNFKHALNLKIFFHIQHMSHVFDNIFVL